MFSLGLMKLRQLDFDLLIESVLVIFYLSSSEPCGKKTFKFLSFAGKGYCFLLINLNKLFHHYKSYDILESKLVIALLRLYERR